MPSNNNSGKGVKMRKYCLSIFFVTLILIFWGCKSLLPVDPFISIKNEEVLAKCVTLQSDGGFEGEEYDLTLVFTEDQKKTIKAVEWKLLNSLNDSLFSRIDTVAVSEKEEERIWPADYQFSISTGLLPIETYRLIVAIYDDFLKQDDKVIFRTAKFKRSFTFEFEIAAPPALSGIFVKSLGEDQDTGYSKTDLITKVNKDLTFLGETKVDPDITSSSDTKVYFTVSKLPDGLESKKSPVLSPSSGGGMLDNSLLWSWTCTDTLSDGRWSVVLHLDTVDKEGSPVSNMSESSFILTIDTVVPEICWSYKLEAGDVVKNKDNAVDLPITDIPVFDFGFPADLEGQSLKDEKLRFARWAAFACTDSSGAYHSGVDGDPPLYAGTNFDANQEGDYKGFDPYVAGTQEIVVSAWDAAGNKSSNTIKRRIRIKDPILRKNFVNGSFSEAPGVDGYGYTANPEHAKYIGWESKIYWLEYWDKPYQKVSQDNPAKIKTNGWNKNFTCFVKKETDGNRVLNFVEYYKNTGGLYGNRYFLSSGGKVYQTFVLYKGVSYALSGKSANGSPSGSTSNPPEASALFVEHVNSTIAPVFVGNGKTGGFPFMLEQDSIDDGNHIYYKPFVNLDDQMESQTLTFTAPSSGSFNMGFAKKGYNSTGDYGSRWTLCDDASLAITDWPKVNSTPLTP